MTDKLSATSLGSGGHGTGGPNNQNSLVKFEPPVVVSYVVGKSSIKFTNAMRKKPRVSTVNTGKPSAVCEDALEDKQVEEILAAIIPPMEWEDDGRIYRQQVSSEPATRIDLMDLQEKLDLELKRRQAREDGIDPTRRELYSQCFDELIRQAAIDSPERGLLLLRVRDEVRMTLRAYEALHESSSAYGIKKAAMSDNAKIELEKKMNEELHERHDLEDLVFELKTKLELADRTYQEQKEADDKKHWEEMQFAKRAHQLLKQQLEGLLSPVMPEPDDYALIHQNDHINSTKTTKHCK